MTFRITFKSADTFEIDGFESVEAVYKWLNTGKALILPKSNSSNPVPIFPQDIESIEEVRPKYMLKEKRPGEPIEYIPISDDEDK